MDMEDYINVDAILKWRLDWHGWFLNHSAFIFDETGLSSYNSLFFQFFSPAFTRPTLCIRNSLKPFFTENFSCMLSSSSIVCTFSSLMLQP